MPNSRLQNREVPRPFLKWAGGKGQLLPELLKRVDRAGGFGRYHEPFVGGGALFFRLTKTEAFRKKAWLSDNNAPLIETYLGIRNDLDPIIALLEEHARRHCEAYYYEVRAEVPDTRTALAARIIYLNKTCFNGLYRENSKGLFNTPIGRYKNPTICDVRNLTAAAQFLKKAKIENRPFETILQKAKPGDFVYFDPPYHPVSKSASFTAYDKGGFGEEPQRRLAQVFQILSDRGVKVLLSNSMTDFVRDLYRNFTIEVVLARRAVNSRADRRGKIEEALIRNY